MSTTLDLLLIRTGRTSWEDAGRIVGSCDLPLSELGLARTREVLDALREVPVSTILAAEDEASATTAAMVEEALGGKRRAIRELSEMSLGLWEGMKKEELGEKLPKCYRALRENPGCVCAPEGETLEGARERLMAALAKGVSRVKEGVVCVVLRPIAYTLIADALEGVETESLDSKRGDWLRLRTARKPIRPRNPVSSRRSA